MDHRESTTESEYLRLRVEMHMASVRAQDEAAKQLLTLGGIFQTLFFGAISLSDLKKVMSVQDAWYIVFVALTLLTIVGWSICIHFSAQVLIPRRYTPEESMAGAAADEAAQRFFTPIQSHKQVQLKYALYAMRLSFIPLAMNIAVYLIAVPRFPP